ncbi:hypothetical protein [Nocardia fusca]|uniref:2-keto-4-pentenoate hydratase n=1 Tax=Nocardia fusca TaxID=941183 RepID=A0ABV3F3D7_9NOCA
MSTDAQPPRLHATPPPGQGGMGGYFFVRSRRDGAWRTGRLSPARYVTGGAVRVPGSGVVRVEPAVVLTVGRTIHGPGAGAVDVSGALTAIRSALVIRADPDGADEGIGGTSGPGVHAVAVSARSLAFGDVDPGLLGFTVHAAGTLRASGAVAAATGWIDAVAQLADRLATAGEDLPPGSALVVGSLTATLPVTEQTTVTATFARIGALTVHLNPETSGAIA